MIKGGNYYTQRKKACLTEMTIMLRDGIITDSEICIKILVTESWEIYS